jgi:sulfite oxidase
MSDQQRQPTEAAEERRTPSTTRREFLARAAGAGGLLLVGSAACERATPPSAGKAETETETAGPAALPAGKDPANFVVHSETPLEIETKRTAYGSGVVVPAGLLFVRNNLPIPDESFVANRDAWKLAVEGVGAPRELTLGELKGLGLVTMATVVQCSGNGRGFFQHKPSGSPWQVGAAGCVIWSGVPVRAVAEALGGVSAGARFVTGTGGEVLPTGEGLNPQDVVVERSIPLEKGMEDAFLAWEMNGEPIPLVHGGPLRLIVPGYYGINQVKFIKRLAFTPAESEAKIQKTGYRVRPIGTKADPSQPSAWAMGVKSWINHPGDSVRGGRLVVDGVAFGGTEEVRRVEVSIDGGRSWREAPLVGPNLGRYAWRQFALPVELPPGSHTLMSRATDAAGRTQPEARQENESGYANTSWRDAAVTLTVS